METSIRIITMVLFIVLVAIGIVMFTVFGILPAERLSQKANEPPAASSTPPVSSEPVSSPAVSGSSAPSEVPNLAPVSGPNYFEIRIQGGKFSPATISVKEWSVMTFNIVAVDENCNISFPDFGVSKFLSKGTSASLQFQVSRAGDYKFTCGGSFTGDLIVTKAQ